MMTITTKGSPWLLFMFGLSAKEASQRVDIWRRLRRYGAIALRSSGYVLPNSPANEERLQWLAKQVRKYRGQATIVHAEAFDGVPSAELTRRFVEERSKEYAQLLKEFERSQKQNVLSPARLARLRKRFGEVVDRDYFGCPARDKVEAILAKVDEGERNLSPRARRRRKEFVGRTWVTRYRPGIDRVASAWLIRRFIDNSATFVFAADPKEQPGAVPFDMFSEEGFGHRGDECTFETLIKEFAIDDRRLKTIAQAVHDADLDDERYGRVEARGLDRVLSGWAHQGLSDDELLRRGMELFEGLYQGI
jgi:hypothetical protein